MIVKIYGTLWAMVILAALIFFAAGLFTNLMGVVFGFMLITLVFMGMLAVLPSTFSKHSETPHEVVSVSNMSKQVFQKSKNKITEHIAPHEKIA